MFKEFKKVILRGNVMDIVVGIIIGVAFITVVSSLVSDLIFPPLSLLFGGLDFDNMFLILSNGTPAGPYATLTEAQTAGAITLNYGSFIATVVSFAIIAFITFLMARDVSRKRKKKEKASAEMTTKECPYCFSTVPIKAVRCAHCTSELKS
jgi:large conductance mechanosensitive channel